MNQKSEEKQSVQKSPGAGRELAGIGSAGVMSGLILAFFAVGGYYLDLKLGWKPVLTIVGICFGLVGSFVALIRAVTRKSKNDKN